ncbi:MAG TPA: hypothetical protein VGU25_15825 [Acidobacteriaceae bacterium]|nr:hypothetical protein [Acidobacteriaceae bacterium]
MLFTNLTSVSFPRRIAGRFASFALMALLAGTLASAQSSDPAQQSNPAPGTAPMQQPSSSSSSQSTSSSGSQSAGQAAPGTVPMKSNQAAAELAPGKGPSYQNHWDLYGGLAFANGQAGQNLPKRFNMGGGEGQFTYWLTHKFGVAADYRFGAGTTPVLPVGSAYGLNRVLVMNHIFAGGVQYRGPRNRYVAINYHGFVGGDYGIFDHAVQNYPGGSPVAACPIQQPNQNYNLGLYCNHVAPWGAVGGSIDFNQGQKFAVRLSPDLTFEHFGTETREFFGISLGLLYRGAR